MKVLFAPDKFKGSCPADAAAAAMARGWLAVFPADEAVLLPVADGGDGTVAAMHTACGGTLRMTSVRGPLGEAVQAQWLLLPDGSAVIEMAQASGLHLLGGRQGDVRRATTHGVGELLRAALDEGCTRVILGLGGSATNDGGMGLLQALGARFLGEGGELVRPGELLGLRAIDTRDLDPRLSGCRITLASDVTNPLCGPNGASAIFGPQKGATPEDVAHMDACLRALAGVAGSQGQACAQMPGSGAAGGLGWALLRFCSADVTPGIGLVLDAAGFDGHLRGAALVVTGEGALDGQTAGGKAVLGVAARARGAGVPVAVLAGTLADGHEALYDRGVDCAMSIVPGPLALQQAMERAEPLLQAAARRLARLLATGRKITNVGDGATT